MSHAVASAGRSPVTMVHVVKKRLRKALSATDAAAPSSATASAANTPSTQSPPEFPVETRVRHETHQEEETAAAAQEEVVASDSTIADPAVEAASPTTTETTAAADTTPVPQLRTPRRRPEALPTPDFYERYPRAVGPMANVVVSSEQEYTLLCMTAMRIRMVATKVERNVEKGRYCPEDVRKGGLLVWKPLSAKPEYFKLRTSAKDVYGSARYISAKGKGK